MVAGARGDNAAATVAEIQQAGGRAELATLDVTDSASIGALVSGTLERHGRIDIFVNNAGIARDNLMLRMKRDEWDQVLATNLTAAFVAVQAVLKPMIKQRAGRIISIGSVVGEAGNAGQVNYAASKAGLIGFSKALAREVASRNITVNVVTPGLIETDMTRTISDKAQGDWASTSRWDGWGRRPTLPRPCAFSPRTRRRILQGRYLPSMAACTCKSMHESQGSRHNAQGGMLGVEPWAVSLVP